MGYEPEAGFSDAYLVATSFDRTARRLGVKIPEDVSVEKLLVNNGGGCGTSAKRLEAGCAV